MIRPSLSIIETTGPFFAIALVVAVLLRAGAAPEHDVAPAEPPPGRFSAAVATGDTATVIEGDAVFSVPSRAGGDPEADGTTLLSLSADARFSPSRHSSLQPDTAAQEPDSLQVTPEDSLAVPADVEPAPSAPSRPAPPSNGSSPASRNAHPSEQAPHVTVRIPTAMREGETFRITNPNDDGPPPDLRYFPAGRCSIPYEMIRGTANTEAADGRVRGRIRGTLRRVDVYRPADSLGCRLDSLIPRDPSETMEVDVRFEAM